MFYGVLLGLFGTFFEELYNSFIKNRSNKYDFVKLGVITSFFGFLTFFLFGLFKYFFTDLSLHFNTDSIPFLILRLFLEILQTYFTILALKVADRTTFSFIRILTIPLLLIADIIIGYNFTLFSFIGIGIIIFSFLVFNYDGQTLNFKGYKIVLFITINAVFTLSLFKYSISHYGNSVEIDQFIILLGIFLFFVFYNHKKGNNCAFYIIKKDKLFLFLPLIIGFQYLLISYSYLFLNTSIATAVKRAGEMIWSIFSGVLYFKEKNFFKKILFAIFLLLGVFIMVL